MLKVHGIVGCRKMVLSINRLGRYALVFVELSKFEKDAYVFSISTNIRERNNFECMHTPWHMCIEPFWPSESMVFDLKLRS